jgi:hypothetical protein
LQRQPNKQNEQVLLEFRKTPGILPAAAFILGNFIMRSTNFYGLTNKEKKPLIRSWIKR